MIWNPLLARFLALIGVLALFGAVTSPLHASMLGTGELLQAEQTVLERAQVLALLERAEVRARLQAMGVSAEAAVERVARMTEAEIRSLGEGLADLPAGSGVLGVVLFIVVLLVITDALGITDIFPFIHAP